MQSDQAKLMREARRRAEDMAARLVAVREDLARSRRADGAAAAQEAQAAARHLTRLFPASPEIQDA